MDTAIQTNKTSRRRVSDLFFILWAGGAALLSYSLVYMLRKPYTAAAFEDLEVFNMDYKVAVTIVQILGYVEKYLCNIHETETQHMSSYFVR